MVSRSLADPADWLPMTDIYGKVGRTMQSNARQWVPSMRYLQVTSSLSPGFHPHIPHTQEWGAYRHASPVSLDADAHPPYTLAWIPDCLPQICIVLQYPLLIFRTWRHSSQLVLIDIFNNEIKQIVKWIGTLGWHKKKKKIETEH